MRPGRTAVLLVIAGLAIAAGRVGHDRDRGVPKRGGGPGTGSWSAAMARLDSTSPNVRIEALRELLELVHAHRPAADRSGGGGGPRAVAAAADLRKLAALAARKDESLAIRFAALSVLSAEAVGAESAQAIASLSGVLRDETDDAAVRCHVASILASRAADPRCLDALKAAASSHSAEVRQVVFNNLGAMPIDRTVLLALARQGLDDDSRAVRRAAVDVVGSLAAGPEPEPEAIGLIGEIVAGGERDLQIQGLRHLAVLGPESSGVLDRLNLTLASAELDPRERIELASALLDATGDAARYLPPVVAGLRSDSSPVWRAAASRLQQAGRRGGPPGETAATIAAVEPLLGEADADVRSRAAVILARLTRRPRLYTRAIETGLNSRDRDTRDFAAGALHALPASGWQRVVRRRPRVGGPSPRTTGVLLLGLIAYVVWDMKRLARRAAARTGRFTIRKPPRRIHLRPAEQLAWNDEAGVAARVAALRALGFEDVGPLVVDEIAAARLWALVRLDEGIHACIFEQEELGLHVSLTTEYQDGSGFGLTTIPAVHRMEPPPWRTIVTVEPDTDVASLHARHLRERPPGALRPITAAGFADHYARVHADGVDWRNRQGGMSPEAIRALNRSRGVELSDQAIALLRAHLQRRALEELDASLRERFLEPSSLSEADRNALAARLVIVHDGLPLEVGTGPDDPATSPRRLFAEHNQRVAPPQRYARIGELVHPVAADVYLMPEVPPETRSVS
jgi:hypothetical protein